MDLISILGLLGGAVTRLFPHVLDFLKGGRDLKYELQRMEFEVKLEQLRGQNAQQEIAAHASAAVDSQWASALTEAMKTAVPKELVDSGSWFVNILNAINISVRPVLTYWWCVFGYTAYKVCTMYVAFQQGLPVTEWGQIVANDFDRAVVGSIISFWFVDSSLRGKKFG